MTSILLKNKKIISFFFIVLFLCPVIFLLKPQEINASGIPVIDGAHIAVSTAGNVILAGILAETGATAAATIKDEEQTWWKEYILDPIMWTTINILIEKIADSTVDWINGGFNGGPSFVTDLGGFMKDVGDSAIGEFIAGSPLAFLCGPFSLDIKIALSLQFGGKREAYCTLTEVFENVDNAIDDLGNNWSWSKFNSIAQTQNNAYGAYLNAYTELTLKMANEKDKTIQKSSWGSGFLSFDHCEPEEQEIICPPGTSIPHADCKWVTTPEKCSTKTPGKIIEGSLTKVLGLGDDRLVVADEINEIIGALLNQLIGAVFNSAEGLFGSNPSDNGFSKLPASTVGEVEKLITDAMEIEENYKEWKQKSLDIVELAEQYLKALIKCWESYTGNPPADPPLTDEDIANKISSARGKILNEIDLKKGPLGTDISTATTNIEEKLQPLLDRIAEVTDDNGEADPNDILLITNDFKNLTGLHTDSDISLAEQEFHGPPTEDGIESKMNNIITQVTTDKIECLAGGGTFELETE